MKQLSWKYVYWKNINKDIKRIVKSCTKCAQNQTNSPKACTILRQNWERIHIAHASPFLNRWFLIVVDARSKWAEVEIEKQVPTSESIIRLLQKNCSTHGYPSTIVSDNATVFTSCKFLTFCQMNDIQNKYITPNYPQTNGLAERNVQTLKKKLLAFENEQGTIAEKVQKFFLNIELLHWLPKNLLLKIIYIVDFEFHLMLFFHVLHSIRNVSSKIHNHLDRYMKKKEYKFVCSIPRQISKYGNSGKLYVNLDHAITLFNSIVDDHLNVTSIRWNPFWFQKKKNIIRAKPIFFNTRTGNSC